MPPSEAKEVTLWFYLQAPGPGDAEVVRGGGRILPAGNGTAIWMGGSHHNIVSHNGVCHFYCGRFGLPPRTDATNVPDAHPERLRIAVEEVDPAVRDAALAPEGTEIEARLSKGRLRARVTTSNDD